MATKADMQFGRLAVQMGIVSAEQLEKALRVEQASKETKPLGLVLLEQGVLDEEQLNAIIEAQRQSLRERAQHTREKRDDMLFGRLVLRLGLASEQQIAECLRVQGKVEEDLFLRLGEIMVRKNFLTPDQVQQVLDFQRKKILSCPSCSKQYNIIMWQPNAEFTCYKCGHVLKVPDRLQTVEAEDYPKMPPKGS